MKVKFILFKFLVDFYIILLHLLIFLLSVTYKILKYCLCIFLNIAFWDHDRFF